MLDMDRVHMNENNKKTKKCPGVRRRFVMKYRTKLKTMATIILDGISQSIEETASENG